MRLLVDECVPKPTRLALYRAHHELLTVDALGRAGATNGELLNLAAQHRAILITMDRGIGHLQRFPLGTHAGIVVIKLARPAEIAAVNKRLCDALKALSIEQLTGSLVIIDRQKFRLRRPAA